ncbi:MAG: YidC/Oxa1 family membrane protein insertase [Candidatus Paceibacterota bacterium]|jgi:YidC/Oxa1 family membrane protein insertase
MFKTLLFNPLYNILIIIINLIPGGDIGLAIIILTILIKLLILPIYIKSIRTQVKMKEIEPKLKEVKRKYEKDLPEQSKQIMELYKENKVNPFSSFLVLLIQLPIILALFYVFRDSLVVHQDIIYSFVSIPEKINPQFLGLIDISMNKNVVLAILTGLTQFIQVQLTMPKPKNKKISPQSKEQPTFGGDFARSMDIQVRYVMPFIISFIAWQLPAAISLYWITSNIFHLVSGLKIKKEQNNPLSFKEV